MLIYIRHGHDEDPDPTYRHDNKLSSKGHKQVKDKVRELIKLYGIPDMILISPFRRTKETASVMKKYISKEYPNSKTKSYYDSRLSRYFTSKERRDPDISPATDDKVIPIDEGNKEFRRRVKKHVKEISKSKYKKKIIWCVTHTLVIKRVAEIFETSVPDHFEFLETIVIKRSFSEK